ncbi:queuosine biosynthesis protein QueC, partial [Vibrio parahaemolyticus VPTS-2010]
SDDQNTADVAQ